MPHAQHKLQVCGLDHKMRLHRTFSQVSRIPWKEGYFTLTVGKLFGCLAECLSVCAWCRCRRQPPQQIRRYLGGDGSEEIGDEIPAAIRTRSVTKAERSPTLSSFVGVAAA